MSIYRRGGRFDVCEAKNQLSDELKFGVDAHRLMIPTCPRLERDFGHPNSKSCCRMDCMECVTYTDSQRGSISCTFIALRNSLCRFEADILGWTNS